MATKLTLTAARSVPWAPTINLFYSGEPLVMTGATVAMQVRLYPGAPGAALAEDASVAFTEEAATDAEIAANGLAEGARVLRLFPEIAEAVLAAFPTGLNAPEPGEADTFAYDVTITYADATVDRPIAGAFLLEPGVTD